VGSANVQVIGAGVEFPIDAAEVIAKLVVAVIGNSMLAPLWRLS